MGSMHLHRLTGIHLEQVEAKELEGGRRYYVRTLRIMGPGENDMEINLFSDKREALMTAEELQAEEENKEELAKSAFRREMLTPPPEVNGAVERMLDGPEMQRLCPQCGYVVPTECQVCQFCKVAPNKPTIKEGVLAATS